MIKKIDHIGINVRNLEEGIKKYRDILGLQLLQIETLEQWGCKIAFFDCSGVLLELVQPIGPGMAQTFIDEYGEGISHICYETDDIEKMYENCRKTFGVKEGSFKVGAGGSKVFFANKENLFGCETEFVEL